VNAAIATMNPRAECRRVLSTFVTHCCLLLCVSTHCVALLT
jgi:hypothetical protein